MVEKILIVDDEKEIADLIEVYLQNENMDVYKFYSGEEVLVCIGSTDFDLAILDIMLPDISGLSICQSIRSKEYTYPVIMLTAKDGETDKITGLTLGADDYITKPFSVEELLARIRVTQRRLAITQTGEQQETSVFKNGELEIDYSAGCAYLKGEELHLTPIEYKLLCLLSRNVGKVLTHTFITQQIWGQCSENDIASLRVFMATLRKKLEPEKNGVQYIQTHIGIGYRMIRIESNSLAR